MPIVTFEDAEEAYGTWLADHPDGFVANVSRRKRLNYFVVHRASCGTITPGSRSSRDAGAFTARDYRKAAAEDMRAVVEWGEDHGFKNIRACGLCRPGEV